MRSARIKYTLLHNFLPLILVMLVGISEVKGQTKTYATNQNNGVSGGICVLCGVTDPTFPITPSITDFSVFKITVGLGNIAVQQTLIFPSVNTNEGCDELVIGLGSDATLLTAALLGGVKIETFNGAASNNDERFIDGSILILLGLPNQAEVRFTPTKKFDRVKVTLTSSLLGALSNFRLYYAYTLSGRPSLATIPAQSICNGQSINLATLNPVDNNGVTGGTYTWSLLQGGTALSSTTVSPSTTTTYWVRYARFGCYDDKSVTVTVKPTPTLSSAQSLPAICTTTAVNYVPTSLTSNTSFSWTRATVAGISNAAITVPVSGPINETLTNTTLNPVTVTYSYTLNANGCSNTQNVSIVINPKFSKPNVSIQ